MIEPKDLSLNELKSFHKQVREKRECAMDNRIKAEAGIVLSMLDEEFEKRGYNIEKLFNGYKSNTESNYE